MYYLTVVLRVSRSPVSRNVLIAGSTVCPLLVISVVIEFMSVSTLLAYRIVSSSITPSLARRALTALTSITALT